MYETNSVQVALARTAGFNLHSISQQHDTRTLLQDTTPVAPQDVTSVSTPEEFVAAIRQGALDIVVNEHLDLTTNATKLLPTGICQVGCESPLGVIANTRSIRVRSSLVFYVVPWKLT